MTLAGAAPPNLPPPRPLYGGPIAIANTEVPVPPNEGCASAEWDAVERARPGDRLVVLASEERDRVWSEIRRETRKWHRDTIYIGRAEWAERLGIHGSTVRAAILELERQGRILVAAGPRKTWAVTLLPPRATDRPVSRPADETAGPLWGEHVRQPPHMRRGMWAALLTLAARICGALLTCCRLGRPSAVIASPAQRACEAPGSPAPQLRAPYDDDDRAVECDALKETRGGAGGGRPLPSDDDERGDTLLYAEHLYRRWVDKARIPPDDVDGQRLVGELAVAVALGLFGDNGESKVASAAQKAARGKTPGALLRYLLKRQFGEDNLRRILAGAEPEVPESLNRTWGVRQRKHSVVTNTAANLRSKFRDVDR